MAKQKRTNNDLQNINNKLINGMQKQAITTYINLFPWK